MRYFKEELWPNVELFCQRLGIDEAKGFEIFMAFCRIDADQSGQVSVKECMVFLGGNVTKFTERLFDIGNIAERGGMNFQDFLFALWNFSTLYTVLLAK